MMLMRTLGRVIGCAVCLASASTAQAQNAADAYFDAEEMAAARMALKHGHGDHIGTFFLAERFEAHANDGDASLALEAHGWLGGDIQKLWLKFDAEHDASESSLDELEVQGLYSRAIRPFWDLQVGVRQDIQPGPAKTHAVLGVQGVAPYWFEIDSALFVSERGDISARVEAEYEFRLSQRLLLQPRVELNTAFFDDEESGLASGDIVVNSGLRLRLEVTRHIAPYFGISWQGVLGGSRKHDSEDPFSLVAGVRFWF